MNVVDKIRIALYTVVVFGLTYAGTKEYLEWLNPYNMKVEESPKQHDGSQEFNPPRPWESSVTPIDEDGVRRYLNPWELYKHGSEETEDNEKVVE
jgi:CRISPR/Cas system-associated protein Cas5 (RAMP superfamily)